MRRVLIVESDLVIGMGYMRAFIVAGFDVERVANESKAMEAISRYKPDAAVINVLIPAGKALKIIKWIRSESQSRDLPIVAFAREAADVILTEAQLAGANACYFVGKSGAQELLAAVRDYVNLPAESPPPTEKPPASAAPTVGDTKGSASEPPALSAASAEPEIAPPPPPPKPPVKEEPPLSDHARTMLKLKDLSQLLLKSENKAARPPVVLELLRKAQDLAGQEVIAATLPLTGIAGALLALLKELSERPEAINTSSIRTINQTVTFLDVLLKLPAAVLDNAVRPFKVLGVDDEIIARKAILSALESVQLAAEGSKDPREALELSKAQRYDLFILDVNMPGMTGFELCEKLRASAAYKETPVIFVTASDTFDSRLRFARSGADDFIGKPFLRSELATKALIRLLDRQIHPNKS
jgi:DNA-binding response OmpR family regulator